MLSIIGMTRSCSGNWSPDIDHHMLYSSNVVTGGQWEGGIPAPKNVEIIAYLDAMRTVPSDKHPSLEFDILTILQCLSHRRDRTVCNNVLEVVRIWKESVICCISSKHVQSWKNWVK